MEQLINKSKYLFGLNFENENKLILLYALGLFIFPFIITQQLILGTLVNALLIKSSTETKSNKVLLLSIVPSVAVLASGYVFGALNSQMLYMLPFIWVGNLVLMLLMRNLFTQSKKNYFVSAIIGASAKTIFIFSVVVLLFTQSLVPVLFLTAFGVIQLITAIAGATIVYVARVVWK